MKCYFYFLYKKKIKKKNQKGAFRVPDFLTKILKLRKQKIFLKEFFPSHFLEKLFALIFIKQKIWHSTAYWVEIILQKFHKVVLLLFMFFRKQIYLKNILISFYTILNLETSIPLNRILERIMTSHFTPKISNCGKKSKNIRC